MRASRYRLQIHHVNSWAQGGETNPEDLVVLCWFHHQVVIHQRGFSIYRHPDPRSDPVPRSRPTRPTPTHLNPGVTHGSSRPQTTSQQQPNSENQEQLRRSPRLICPKAVPK